MDTVKRLFRKPFTTVIWVLIVALMTGFLTVGSTLYYSSAGLAKTLDANHRAIAVRSDPSVRTTKIYRSGLRREEIEKRTFTKDDAQSLLKLPGVKAVLSHTLTGCTSESLSPVLGLNRYMGWTTEENADPYVDVVAYGTVTKAVVMNPGYIQLRIDFGDYLLLDPEFESARKAEKLVGEMIVEAESPRERESETGFVEPDEVNLYFEEGETYVFRGKLEFSGREHTINMGFVTLENGLVMGREFDEDGFSEAWDLWEGDIPEGHEDSWWAAHPDETPEPYPPPDPATQPKKEDFIAAEAYPAAQKLEGSPETFFSDTEYEEWHEYKAAWDRQHHSLPLIGTDELECFFAFLNGDAVIAEGRSFTKEEYENGERVLIISEQTAERTKLEVGSVIEMSQYPVELGGSANDPVDSYIGKPLNNPNIGEINVSGSGPAEPYTVVGIYRLKAAWTEGSFSITPNVVFVPRSAQMKGAFGELPDKESDGAKDIYGIYLSVKLENGRVDDFRAALEDSPYKSQFYPFDQGFEAAQKSLNGLAYSSLRLAILAAIGWILFLLLFLLLYQAAQRRNIGVMRSLGASPGATSRYLFGSGFAVAAAGTVLGMTAVGFVLKTIQGNILSDILASIDRTAYGGALVISEEQIADMVRTGSPEAWQLAVFGAAQLVVIAVLLLIQAKVLTRKLPRELLAAK